MKRGHGQIDSSRERYGGDGGLKDDTCSISHTTPSGMVVSSGYERDHDNAHQRRVYSQLSHHDPNIQTHPVRCREHDSSFGIAAGGGGRGGEERGGPGRDTTSKNFAPPSNPDQGPTESDADIAYNALVTKYPPGKDTPSKELVPSSSQDLEGGAEVTLDGLRIEDSNKVQVQAQYSTPFCEPKRLNVDSPLNDFVRTYRGQTNDLTASYLPCRDGHPQYIAIRDLVELEALDTTPAARSVVALPGVRPLHDSNALASGSTLKSKMRPCYALIAMGAVTIVGSLVPALWRSTAQGDISGGSTLTQDILGVDIFVVGSVLAVHTRTCRC